MDDLFALAAEIRADHPELSMDQALDAAAMMLPELELFAETWNGETQAQALETYLLDWDAFAASAGNPSALGR